MSRAASAAAAAAAPGSGQGLELNETYSFVRGSTGNQKALDQTNPFTAEIGLRAALDRAASSKAAAERAASARYLKPLAGSIGVSASDLNRRSRARAGSSSSSTSVASSRYAAPQGDREAAVAAAQSTMAQIGMRQADTRAGASSAKWKPYATMKLNGQNKPNSQMAQLKRTNIARVLSEVRALQPQSIRPSERTSPRRRIPQSEGLHPGRPALNLAATRPSERLRQLHDSRRDRHFAAQREYREIRHRIDVELQAQVEDASSRLRQDIQLSDDRLKYLFEGAQGLDRDEHLVALNQAAIDDIWSVTIAKEFEDRELLIASLGEALNQVEDRRVELVEREIHRLVDTLVEAAFRAPQEIERSLESETEQVNVHVLRNKTSYADLLVRLRVVEVKRKEAIRLRWLKRKEAWRGLRHEHAVSKFLAKLDSPMFSRPPARRKLFNKLMRAQTRLQNDSMQRVEVMSRLLPPEISVQQVKQLTTQLQVLYVQADKKCDDCLLALQTLEDNLHQKANQMMESLRARLVDIGSVDAAAVDAQIAERCAPLVEQRHQQVVDLLDRVGGALARENGDFIVKVDGVSAFFLNLATQWEEFIANVNSCNKKYSEDLAFRHDRYDDTIASLEKMLKRSVLDLSREPTEERLQAKFKEIGTIVGPGGKIEVEHRAMASEGSAIAREHPVTLKSLILDHLTQVASSFGLRSKHEDDRIQAEEQAATRVEAEAAAAAAVSAAQNGASGRRGKRSTLTKPSGGAASSGGSSTSTKSKRAQERAAAAAVAEAEAAALAAAEAEAARPRVIVSLTPDQLEELDGSHSIDVAVVEPETEQSDEKVDPLVAEAQQGRMFYVVEDVPDLVQRVVSTVQNKDDMDDDVEEERKNAEARDQPQESALEEKNATAPVSAEQAAADAAADAKRRRQRRINKGRAAQQRRNSAARTAAKGETEPTADEAAGSGSRRRRGRKETAAERSAREEEEARLEAERQAAEEAERLAALQAEEEAKRIPEDSDGLPTFQHVEFDTQMLINQLPAIRDSFLSNIDLVGFRQLTQSNKLCVERENALANELDRNLRVHRPRYSRLETDVVEPRSMQLEENQRRFKRHKQRILSMQEQTKNGFDEALQAAQDSIVQFSEWLENQSEKIEDARSLAAIRSLNKQGVNAKLELEQNVNTDIAVLRKYLEESRTHLVAAQDQFIGSCVSVEDDPKLGTYHPDELLNCRAQVDLMTEQVIDQMIRDCEAQVDKLHDQLVGVLDTKHFEEHFRENEQELAVTQGLGHKYGAPKRLLTATLRSEYAACAQAHADIDGLMDALGYLIENGKPSDDMQARKAAEIAEHQKAADEATAVAAAAAFEEQKASSAEDSAAKTDDNDAGDGSNSASNASSPAKRRRGRAAAAAAAASSAASAEAEEAEANDAALSKLSNADIAELSSTTGHALAICDALRTRLLDRVTHLQCFRPKLPAISNNPVNLIVPLGDDAPLVPENAVEEADRSRPNSPEERSAGRTSRARKIDRSGRSRSNKAKARGRRPSTSGNDGAGSEEEKEPSSVAGSFAAIVHEADQLCRRQMEELYKEYDAANPDRHTKSKKAEATKRAREAEERRVREEAAAAQKSSRRGRRRRGGASAASASAAADHEAAQQQWTLPPAVEAHCRKEVKQAQDRLARYVRRLRRQADRVVNLISRVPRVVMEDIQKRTLEEVSNACFALQQKFEAALAASDALAVKHSSQLKPSLMKQKASVLASLCEQEDRRFAEAQQLVQDHRDAIHNVEVRHARMFRQRLLHATSVLLTCFDAMLTPSDLPDPEEGQQVARLGLKALIRERQRLVEQRNEAASSDGAARAATPQSMAQQLRFQRTQWKGVVLNDFVLPQDAAEAAAAEEARLQSIEEAEETAAAAAAAATAAAGGRRGKRVPKARGGRAARQAEQDAAAAAAEAAEAALNAANSPAVSGYQIAANRATIACRDRAKAEYLDQFRERVQDVAETADARLLAAQKKKQQWDRNVDGLSA